MLLCVVGLLAGCTNSDRAQSVLAAQGYKDINMTGYSFFACGQDDTFSDGFTATTVAGTRVSGTVCSGLLKGSTIRF